MEQIAVKVFKFVGGEKRKEEELCVSIPEVLDPQYGMYVWPCAVVLAQYLWTHRAELRGKTLLELGAGVALPGVVAAYCGARLFLSDRRACLQNIERSCRANGLQGITVVDLSWGDVCPDLLALPKLDYVLGSDLFYDPQDFEDVLVTFVFLLRRNPGLQFWTTYQLRSADWSIEAMLHKWNLDCNEVPLDHFEAEKSELAGSELPGRHSVQMIIIRATGPSQCPDDHHRSRRATTASK